jgi:hypothetical protein
LPWPCVARVNRRGGGTKLGCDTKRRSLLKACTTADRDWIAFCNGYLQAAFDATGGKGICAPNGVTRNQLFDIIIPKLMHAPDLLELNAVSVVDALLRKAYPCN